MDRRREKGAPSRSRPVIMPVFVDTLCGEEGREEEDAKDLAARLPSIGAACSDMKNCRHRISYSRLKKEISGLSYHV